MLKKLLMINDTAFMILVAAWSAVFQNSCSTIIDYYLLSNKSRNINKSPVFPFIGLCVILQVIVNMFHGVLTLSGRFWMHLMIFNVSSFIIKQSKLVYAAPYLKGRLKLT